MPLIDALFDVAMYATLASGSIVLLAVMLACLYDVYDFIFELYSEGVRWVRRRLGI